MTPAARLAAAIEVLAQVSAGHLPADGIVSGYVRGRRYIGAKDRTAITSTI